MDRKEWTAEALPIHGYRITDTDGREIVRDVYLRVHAEQIVNDHNGLNALLEAVRTAADQADRASLVQDRSVGIIKQQCAVIASDLRAALAAIE